MSNKALMTAVGTALAVAGGLYLTTKLSTNQLTQSLLEVVEDKQEAYFLN